MQQVADAAVALAVDAIEADQEAPVVAAADENVRQGRELADAVEPLPVEEESKTFDEDLGESTQWSIINLFSRVFPHHA